MNLEIFWTGRFKKDYKKAMKQGLALFFKLTFFPMCLKNTRSLQVGIHDC